jgi:LacI family gluconate utilization system Gnt-I transcriptional repressor
MDRSETRGRPATLSDVARHAGVSPVTVSRTIRHPEMVSEGLRDRVEAAIRALNYIPNHLASALASTRTHIVGVVVPSLTNGVFDDYLAAIQDLLVPAGIQILVSNTRYSEREEERLIETLLGYHPEAMIVTGVDQTERSRYLLKNSRIPVVQTMDLAEEPIDLNIGLSHTEAGRAAVHFLHAKGHRRIAHLTARGDPRARRRRAGYQLAMEELGLDHTGLVAASPQPSNVEMGGALLLEILDRVPDLDAVFCCNDDLALGVLFECQRRGISVPDQLGIVGFNDLDFCVASVPPLTTVSTERRLMGTWAAERVLELIRGAGKRPASHVVDLGFRIRERGSTTVRATLAPLPA